MIRVWVDLKADFKLAIRILMRATWLRLVLSSSTEWPKLDRGDPDRRAKSISFDIVYFSMFFDRDPPTADQSGRSSSGGKYIGKSCFSMIWDLYVPALSINISGANWSIGHAVIIRRMVRLRVTYFFGTKSWFFHSPVQSSNCFSAVATLYTLHACFIETSPWIQRFRVRTS